MKRFFIKLSFFTPVLIVLVSVNFFIDPANLYRYKASSGSEELYEQQLVNFLLGGFHVTNIDSYDERVFNKLFVESIQGVPDVVIFGSSKSQLIDSSFFPGKTVVNNSVTGAALEDIVALFNVYRRTNKFPEKVVIELSPGILNDNNSQTRWKVLEDEYLSLLSATDSSAELENAVQIPSIPPKYYELVSFEYFQESLKYMYAGNSASNPFLLSDSLFVDGYILDSLFAQFQRAGFNFPKLPIEDKLGYLNLVLEQESFYSQWASIYTDYELMDEDNNLIAEIERSKVAGTIIKENVIKRNRRLMEAVFWEHCPIAEQASTYGTRNADNSGMTIKTDGTVSYPETFRNRTVEQGNYAAIAAANKGLVGFDNFNQLSSSKIDVLKKLFRYASVHGIEIVLMLGAYHPIVYDKTLSENVWQITAAEELYNSLAKEYGLKVWGSYNPSSNNYTEADFYDGAHLKKNALLLNVNQLSK